MKVGVNTFRSLLPHQACPNFPPPHPWHNMMFQNVHFGHDCSMWEGLPVIGEEGCDVIFWIENDVTVLAHSFVVTHVHVCVDFNYLDYPLLGLKQHCYCSLHDT
jgi:hypothetical protein